MLFHALHRPFPLLPALCLVTLLASAAAPTALAALGWPLLARCTASMLSARMALARSCGWVMASPGQLEKGALLSRTGSGA
jgi:hypothetical protein